MTGAEWEADTDPINMLHFLRGQASDRKLRLFAVACCRIADKLLADKKSRHALNAAEAFADGLIARKEMVAAGRAVGLYLWRVDPATGEKTADHLTDGGRGVKARSAALLTTGNSAWRAARDASTLVASSLHSTASGFMTGRNKKEAAEPRAIADLLRDVVGNPVKTVKVKRQWLAWGGGTVVNLAQAAYDSRKLPSGFLDSARLAVLADALEEAGCTNADILSHLRGPGPHVRGCWVVDLILGKQ